MAPSRPSVFRIVTVTLAILLVAAVCVAALRIWNQYRDTCALRLDPLEIHQVASTAPKSYPNTVIVFGDSRAAQWSFLPGSVTEATAYVNRGIHGQTTAQVLGRFEAHVAPLAPDVLILQAGSNDLKCIPLFPDQAAEIERNCVENLTAIVTRAADAGATVIVTTIFPHGRIPLHRRLIFDERVTQATRRVNEELKRLSGPRIIVLDTWAVLAGPDGRVRPEFERDLLHLTPAGYAALNAQLESVLVDEVGNETPGRQDDHNDTTRP